MHHKNKVACIFSILLITTVYAPHMIAHTTSTHHQSSIPITTASSLIQQCYGFILPAANNAIENQKNCKTRQLINDLLRENIPVLWTAKNATASIKTIPPNRDTIEMVYATGSFIVPFTGNIAADSKTCAIMYDYNQSSEIDEPPRIPAYVLMEPVETLGYQLKHVKIAIYRDRISCIENRYMEIANDNGFLNVEYLYHDNIKDKLTTNLFDIIIWPAACPSFSIMAPNGGDLLWNVYDDVKYGTANVIRSFVANGGGFLGSCYAGFKAARGHKNPLGFPSGSVFSHFNMVYPKQWVSSPQLPAAGLLAITDMLVGGIDVPEEKPVHIQTKIVNSSHPLAFGIPKIVRDYHVGPLFSYVGESVDVIAEFHNTGFDQLDKLPLWISSSFGNGKVVLFASHPEIVAIENNTDGYIAQRVVSNSLLYHAAGEKTEHSISQPKNLSGILNVFNKTAEITCDKESEEDIFSDIYSAVNNSITTMKTLRYRITRLREQINTTAKEKNINPYTLGSDSMARTNHLFSKFIQLANDANTVVHLIEAWYPLLVENNSAAADGWRTLKSELLYNLNQTQDICTSLCSQCETYTSQLATYRNTSLFSNIREMTIENSAHKMYRMIKKGYDYLPSLSLKSSIFLRKTWYTYEAQRAS